MLVGTKFMLTSFLELHRFTIISLLRYLWCTRSAFILQLVATSFLAPKFGRYFPISHLVLSAHHTNHGSSIKHATSCLWDGSRRRWRRCMFKLDNKKRPPKKEKLTVSLAGHKSHRQLRNSLHILTSPPQNAETRKSRCTHGSHGSHAGRVC